MSEYFVPAGSGEAEFVEKRSSFLGHVRFVETEDAARDFINEMKKKHYDARHNCWCYMIRDGAVRYSDDGEPAKTAGLPVLEAIRHAGLTDCVVVVTRYFGGILLGTGGLVRAYTQAAKLALEAAPSGTMRVCVRLTVTVEYPLYERADLLLRTAGAHMEEPEFTHQVTLRCVLPQGEEAPLIPKLQEWSRGAAAIEVSPGFYTAF